MIIKKIDDRAFERVQFENDLLVIPNGTTNIGAWSFSRSNIRQIANWPKSLSQIEMGAFFNTKLDRLYFNATNIQYIDKFAFAKCDLKELIILDNIEIGDYAFYSCESLEKVHLGEKLSYISEGMFSNCINLKEITIPRSVKTIYDRGFYNCKKLSYVDLEGVLIIGEEAFKGCNITELYIPNSTREIRKGAFSGCKIKTIHFPKNVGSIAIFPGNF